MELKQLNDIANRAEREAQVAMRLRAHRAGVARIRSLAAKESGGLMSALRAYSHAADVVKIVEAHMDDIADPLLESVELSLEAQAMQHDVAAAKLRRSVAAVLSPAGTEEAPAPNPSPPAA